MYRSSTLKNNVKSTADDKAILRRKYVKKISNRYAKMVNPVPVMSIRGYENTALQAMICLLFEIVIGIIDESIVATKRFIIPRCNSKNNLNKSVFDISHGKY